MTLSLALVILPLSHSASPLYYAKFKNTYLPGPILFFPTVQTYLPWVWEISCKERKRAELNSKEILPKISISAATESLASDQLIFPGYGK